MPKKRQDRMWDLVARPVRSLAARTNGLENFWIASGTVTIAVFTLVLAVLTYLQWFEQRAYLTINSFEPDPEGFVIMPLQNIGHVPSGSVSGYVRYAYYSGTTLVPPVVAYPIALPRVAPQAILYKLYLSLSDWAHMNRPAIIDGKLRARVTVELSYWTRGWKVTQPFCFESMIIKKKELTWGACDPALVKDMASATPQKTEDQQPAAAYTSAGSLPVTSP